ncbi:SDR family NAD(P)-dependent oxidoreductase [Bradyrhizobium sp. WSM3983]|uniref:SDR family NAD(P)-dependent oxidoreductase n=1 Tax=Bradyrhizobium sp. WSM3983 TaxID=1038867 RepID=UPI0009FC101E|nr:SDR family NAD(P)-dependent oxidoreductase [Bradyrhizobium sp. WSM3983]
MRARVSQPKDRILVNCASLGPPGKPIGRDGRVLPLRDFARTININLIGSFNMLSKFAARLSYGRAAGEERRVIINTASVAAFDGLIGQATYAVSKGGIVGITLPLAREFVRYGIRVIPNPKTSLTNPRLTRLVQYWSRRCRNREVANDNGP